MSCHYYYYYIVLYFSNDTTDGIDCNNWEGEEKVGDSIDKGRCGGRRGTVYVKHSVWAFLVYY